ALLILLCIPTADADRANCFAVQHDWQATSDSGDIAEGDNAEVVRRNRILEDLARSLKAHRGPCLTLRHFDRTDLRAVHALEVNQMSTVVEHRDYHGPFVFGRLGFSGGGHFLRRCEA